VNAEIANDAPTKTGGGASGTWNIAISGNALSSTLSVIQDTRSGALTPNDYSDHRVTYEFTNQVIGGDWHSAVTPKGWTDGYAAWQIWGPSSTSAHENWYLRSGINTTWNPLRTILHSGNVSSYVANRAWVKFNGFNGGIYASGGVSSVTYNGTGQSTVNFSTAMPDTNYSAVCSGHSAGFSRQANAFPLFNGFATGSCVIWYGNTVNAAAENLSHVNVAFFR
jgi:hypothetical protein